MFQMVCTHSCARMPFRVHSRLTPHPLLFSRRFSVFVAIALLVQTNNNFTLTQSDAMTVPERQRDNGSWSRTPPNRTSYSKRRRRLSILSLHLILFCHDYALCSFQRFIFFAVRIVVVCLPSHHSRPSILCWLSNVDIDATTRFNVILCRTVDAKMQ